MRYVSKNIVNLYEKSPVWSRSLFSTSYSAFKKFKEENVTFKKYLDKLQLSQWWSKEEILEYQSIHLKKMISYVSKNVPFYKKLFADYSINPKQIQIADDLKVIPFLSKETVRNKYKELISNQFDISKLRKETTSGTTGKPLSILMDNSTFLFSRATVKLHQSWAGYTHKQWIGIFSGYKVIPFLRKKSPFWIKNYYGKQIHFSTYHLSINNIQEYYKCLSESKISYLLGYPSSIGLLAKYINVHIGKSIPLKGIFLGSEPIFNWQRENISKAFGCKIFDYYGQAENIIMALGCGCSDKLHLNSESSITELSKSSDNNYTLIGTTLINYAMPLIRYEMNDFTEGFAGYECECGRKSALIKSISSKLEDFIKTPDGRMISASILTFPFKEPKGILESQIIQEDKYSIVVKLITDDNYNLIQNEKLINDIHQCIGNDMKIFTEQVQEIPRTKNGKFRFVINKVLAE